GRRDSRPAPHAQRGARQDDCHGDARPARRGQRTPRRPPREGPARGDALAGGDGMKYLHLVWRSLLRRQARTIFTGLSIRVARLLFGALMALRGAFAMGIEPAGAERLVMIPKVSFIQPLPLSYPARLASA